MKIHQVEVQIEPPKDQFPGRTVQGKYLFEDGIVMLTDHLGIPVRDRDGKAYSKKLEADEDPRAVAGRLTKQFRTARRGEKGQDANFNRQIVYPKSGIA